MTYRKLLWIAVAFVFVAGVAWADPVRTIFTRENKFPEPLRFEVELFGYGTSYDGATSAEDVDMFDFGPEARVGLTDWLAVRGGLPFRSISIGDLDKRGLGDAYLGADFRFFEDIFEYPWIVPHATVFFPTGDEDKFLGTGKTQARLGVSAGTTVEDVFHFGADVSYVVNGKIDDENPDEWEGLFMGSLSLVWDLNERSSILGEVQVNDAPADPEDDYAFLGHLGLVFRINKNFWLMGYGGGAKRVNQDFYGGGRLVYQF